MAVVWFVAGFVLGGLLWKPLRDILLVDWLDVVYAWRMMSGSGSMDPKLAAELASGGYACSVEGTWRRHMLAPEVKDKS